MTCPNRVHPYAIGDGATLFFLLVLKRAARPKGTAEFATKRLDDLDEICAMDLLKIDIQGAETMVSG